MLYRSSCAATRSAALPLITAISMLMGALGAGSALRGAAVGRASQVLAPRGLVAEGGLLFLSFFGEGMRRGVVGVGKRRSRKGEEKPMPRSFLQSLSLLFSLKTKQKLPLPLTSQSSQYAASGAAMAAALAMAAAAAAAGPRASDWFDDADGSLSPLAPPGLAEYGSFDLALC